MERTLGKRIAEHRKRLGITQDQLAERLGLTAQAISKWENDLSCPDITTLPKLAEIFGTTTDALLGREPEVHRPLFEAEVVEEPASEDADHHSKGSWSFHWDSGRREGITFALLILLVGGLLLATRLLQWDISFWSILWPSALLIYGLRSVFTRFSPFKLGIALLGAYFLVDNLGFWHLDVDSALLFPILVVLFGLGLLADAFRKPKKPHFKLVHHLKNSEHSKSNPKVDLSIEDDHFDCSVAFSECHRVLNMPRLAGGDVSCSFSDMVLDLSGCETIVDGCEIDASCAFGSLALLIPRQYRVAPDSSSAFGAFEVSGTPDPTPKATIRLEASVSFGEIKVRYI